MKILIAYSSKTGTTKTCASLLSKEFPRYEVVIADLSCENPVPEEFDICIIGGSIRMGKLDKRIYTYIQKNIDILSKMKTAYFICNAFNDECEKYFKKCFPTGAVDASCFCESFGGEMKIEKQKGIDKLLVKMILKANEDDDEFVLPSIFTESIGRFADKIKQITV